MGSPFFLFDLFNRHRNEFLINVQFLCQELLNLNGYLFFAVSSRPGIIIISICGITLPPYFYSKAIRPSFQLLL